MNKFKKSSFSKPRPPNWGGCIYVCMQEDSVLVNKNQKGHTLEFTSHEWDVFIKAVKNGEFDLKE